MPVGPSLLAAGMAGSDKCARASVAHHASDYSAACSTPSPISRPLAVFLLLRLLLLLGRRSLLLGRRSLFNGNGHAGGPWRGSLFPC